MVNLTLSKEEAKIYNVVKRRSGAKTDEDILRWLLNDWKRLETLAQSVEFRRIIVRPIGENAYSARGVSVDPGVYREAKPSPKKTMTMGSRPVNKDIFSIGGVTVEPGLRNRVKPSASQKKKIKSVKKSDLGKIGGMGGHGGMGGIG